MLESEVLFIPESSIQNMFPLPSPDTETFHFWFVSKLNSTVSPARTVLVISSVGKTGSTASGVTSGSTQEKSVKNKNDNTNGYFIYVFIIIIMFKTLHSFFLHKAFGLFITHPLHNVVEVADGSYRFTHILHIDMGVDVHI